MKPDEIAHVAQQISFAYEDLFFDESKREKFHSLFEKYLSGIDPSGDLEPYEAIKSLGRTSPDQFMQMVEEMRKEALIPD